VERIKLYLLTQLLVPTWALDQTTPTLNWSVCSTSYCVKVLRSLLPWWCRMLLWSLLLLLLLLLLDLLPWMRRALLLRLLLLEVKASCRHVQGSFWAPRWEPPA